MSIILNHIVVPARSKHEAAVWFSHAFGLERSELEGHFAGVQVNQTLTFLFADESSFSRGHYAFQVSDEEFDSILNRIKAEKTTIGSTPGTPEDGKLNDWNGGRGVLF